MRQLVLTVPASDVELASDALWALGVVAVEERQADAQHVELWTSIGDDALDVDVRLPQPWPWRFEEIDAAVADTWRAFAQPIVVEPDVIVRPAWVPFVAPPDVVVLHIEPGATFGMGDHPTTMLSLRAVRRVVRTGDTLLDVGCGSGVLAIASVRFGAAHATGIDISPAAVPITVANAAANDVGDRVGVSTTDLCDVHDTFDVVVANILAPVLIALADDLRRVLAPGGTLVISGLLDHAYAHVLNALAPLRVDALDELDGWVAITLR